MQKIIKNCVKELNKENQYKKNVIMNIGNNIDIIKTLKDAENKEISNDIEYKKKELDSRNDESNMNILNQILMYPSYCFELQKKNIFGSNSKSNRIKFRNRKRKRKKFGRN